MPYIALDNEGLNYADKVTDHSSYTKIVEAACNAMEADGYRLIAIEQGMPDSVTGCVYIFHKSEEADIEVPEIW